MTGKQCEQGCQLGLMLFTNMKSHTSFGLVSKFMTVNDPERRNDRRHSVSLR